MKTIKFRVFFEETREMIYFDRPFLLAEYSVLSFSPVGEEYNGIGRLPCGLNDASDDIIIEQFTGLLDANGKKIYEEDIVRHNGSEYEIVYCNGAYKCIETKCAVSGACDIWLFSIVQPPICHCEQRVENIVVIGNIHEGAE